MREEELHARLPDCGSRGRCTPPLPSASIPLFCALLQVYLRYARKYGCDLSEQEVLRRFRWGAAMSHRPGIMLWWAGDGLSELPAFIHSSA